jgi:hypothetical protein
MPSVVHLIFLIFAFCCFMFAAWQPGNPQYQRVIAVGLASFILSMLQV